MAVSIKGVRIDSVNLERDDKGVVKMSGSYSLMSNSGKVLAKQDFNGYNGVKVEANSTVLIALEKLTEAIQSNIEGQLGFSEE